jgi:23S rRNA (cytidine2498-2'-O)-methyltransferase
MRRGPPSRSSEGARPSGPRSGAKGRPGAARPGKGRPLDARAGAPRSQESARAPGRPRPVDPREATSPRVAIRSGKPLAGPWLWLTRPGAEVDLSSELRLALGDGAKVQELGSGLVRSELAPTFDDGTLDATFARHGLRVRARSPLDAAAIAAKVIELAAAGPIAFDVVVPDSDEGNRLAPAALALAEQVRAALSAASIEPVPRERAKERDARLLDVVLTSKTEAVIGEIGAHLALTLHGQGRARMKVAADRPSRAARKVEEALDWLGLGPGAGEVCVDLGAAPGGWSWSLLERRARVIAVDPAQLRPDVARHPRLTHVQASAFQFVPDEPVDWLFCDMAWRPREAAQMLAKWARRGWARFLVANLKLPMKTKAAMVKELREILAGGGWSRIRTRQLYHDRDEITVTAHR